MKSDGMLLWQSGLPYAQYFTKKYAPIKVTTAPYLGGIGNFQNNKQLAQQCFVTSEPLTAERAGLKVKTFLVAESGYNPYTTVLVTTREHMQKHPDEVRRMVAAVRAGWAAYLQDPAATNAAMGRINKAMDAQTFRASAVAQVELIQPNSPAIFLAHGDADEVVSSLNSTFLHDVAKTKGVPVECVIVKGAGHGFSGDVIEPSVAEINHRTVEFYLKYLGSL